MIEAQIKEIDLARPNLLIATQDNQEITLTFLNDANIEVHEPTRMGPHGRDLGTPTGCFVDGV